MCVLCSSHINKSNLDVEATKHLESIHPERGHVFLCSECDYFAYQDMLVNNTDCWNCGHQILSPGQLASDPLLRNLKI